jgi:protein disulfide-isomerase
MPTFSRFRFLPLTLLALTALAACRKSEPPAETAPPQHAEKLGVWTQDYAAAVKQAQAEHKQILLDFTGSDWCENCWRLDDGVFSRAAFADYAKTHWVLVTLDFPIRQKLPEDLQAQNQKLMEKYQVNGLPTIVLLDANENKLAMMVGYGGQTPEKFIDGLEHPAPATP